MAEQFSMFDGNVFVKPKAEGLVLSRWSGGRLTKAQRTFNRLVERVDALRSQMEARTRELDSALANYAEDLYPRLQRETSLRKDLALALGPYLKGRWLKQKKDRETLRRLLDQQLRFLIDREGPLADPGLQAVFKQVTGFDFEDVMREEAQEMRHVFESMFSDLGIDADVSDLRPDMSEEEVAAAAARMAEVLQARAEQFESRGGRERPKSARQLEREERARQAEELRKSSVASIYKQLARAVHPDLEQDPELRREKETVMQELTAAYRNNDLHTLLRLELEWIRREEGDLDRMSEEKLAIYNSVLKEQTISLERELNEMLQHPRYQPIVVPDGPFDIRVRNVAKEARELDKLNSGFETLLATLKTGDALAAVHAAIRGFRKEERAAQQAYSLGRSKHRNFEDVPF